MTNVHRSQISASRFVQPFVDRQPEFLTLGIIAAFLVFRLIIAATLGLGVDESYTIANARDLSLSYFDHPPLHYWIAHAFLPILGDGRAARLPFILLFTGSSWLLYLLTRRLFGAWAGVWAVLALNLSAFFTVSAGGFIVPDGPLIFFLLAAAVTLANAFFPVGEASSPWWTWIVCGVCIGLAALSKYHVVLFVAGVVIYLASIPERRRILLHPAPWVGAFIALAMFAPVLTWNSQHGWVSFAYQGGRGVAQGGLHIANFVADLVGQAIWILPWVFVPLVIAAWQAMRVGRLNEQCWYCLCLGIPTIVFFTLTPLWGDSGLPHWSMPGWLMLYPILGDHLAKLAAKEAGPRRWAVISAALLVVLAVVTVGHAATGFGKRVLPAAFKHGDPTLEALEWTPVAAELKARGYLPRDNLFVVVPNWIDAGKLDQALGGALPVIVFADSNEPKNFDFRYDPKTMLGADALIVGRKISPAMRTRIRPFFKSMEELPSFSFGRSGMQEIELQIFLAKDLLTPFPPYYRKHS